MQYGFYFDADRCMQCFACEVACKAEHDLEPHVTEEPGTRGPRWRRVLTTESTSNGDVSVEYLSISCMHCGKPACEAVCPTGAIHKRAEDGIVVVDQSKCIGCHYCFFACPFGIPQYGADGTMQKCNLCVDTRLAEGEKPACVQACCSGALQFGTMEELADLVREKTAHKLSGATQPSMIVAK